MNINELQELVRKQRKDNFDNSDQMSLGQILNELKIILSNIKNSEEKRLPNVVYDFGYMYPTDIDSWRGIYAELALNYTEYKENDKPLDIVQFSDLIELSIGKTFEGYKGGDFLMNESTPVWVANYGNSGNTAVVGILDKGYEVVILTAYRES